jgi:K(+)-stimulated pyrophosphate-energized sodium pump
MLIAPILTGMGAIVLAGSFAYVILRGKVTSDGMSAVASFIRDGANTYLLRQIKTILYFSPVLFVFLLAFLGWREAVTAVFGVLTSLLAAFVGMSVSVRANLRTADAAHTSRMASFRLAVLGGAVMGLCITGFSIIVLSALFLLFRRPEPLVGYGFGASLAALFAQIGGGIFTKSADVGADLVGKVEEKIPEDDPRNAAVVADLVGDNVGDCAGRGADLFESFSDDIITGSIVASTLVPRYGLRVLYFPLLLQCTGILASGIGILATRQWHRKLGPVAIFNLGLAVSTVLSIVLTLAVSKFILGDMDIWVAVMLGLATTLVAIATTRYYAGMEGAPVREIASASQRGAALGLITAIAYGLQSPIASIVMIIVAIILSFNLTGMLFAIVAVNIGTDLLIAFIMASDAFGPIVDNAAGIAEMSHAPRKVVDALSSLDSVGNTMKATTKAYATSSGTVTAFVIFATFFTQTKVLSFDVTRPTNLGFLFVGVVLPFLISSLVIKSTAKGAVLMVDEVRRQFREIAGLLEGKANPDYSLCVDIATKNALKEMILPGVISIAVPIILGMVFGASALGSLLIGAVASSALLGPFFNNVGTALDNAKKLIEHSGQQRGSFAHSAAVIGDTVGDPLKDVAGPSLLIFMKLIGMSALLVAPLVK